MTNKILDTARVQIPLSLFLTWLGWSWDLDSGLSIYLYISKTIVEYIVFVTGQQEIKTICAWTSNAKKQKE